MNNGTILHFDDLVLLDREEVLSVRQKGILELLALCSVPSPPRFLRAINVVVLVSCEQLQQPL